MNKSTHHLKSLSLGSVGFLMQKENTTRVKYLDDKSFISDIPKDHETSNLKSNSSFRSNATTENIKELINQTSERLKSFGSKSLNSNCQSENYEILNLKKRISILEDENEGLLVKNKKLEESLKILSEDLNSDENKEFIKFGKLFSLKTKENVYWSKIFKNIFESEDVFLKKVMFEKYYDISLGLLKFLYEISDSCTGVKDFNEVSCRKLGNEISNYNITLKSDIFHENIHAAIDESKNLSKNISKHKKKLKKVYEKLEKTFSITHNAEKINYNLNSCNPLNTLLKKNLQNIESQLKYKKITH